MFSQTIFVSLISTFPEKKNQKPRFCVRNYELSSKWTVAILPILMECSNAIIESIFLFRVAEKLSGIDFVSLSLMSISLPVVIRCVKTILNCRAPNKFQITITISYG